MNSRSDPQGTSSPPPLTQSEGGGVGGGLDLTTFYDMSF